MPRSKERHAAQERMRYWRNKGLEYSNEYQAFARGMKEGTLTPQELHNGLRLRGRNVDSVEVNSLSNELVERYGTSGDKDMYKGTTKDILAALRDYKDSLEEQFRGYEDYLKEGGF